MEHLSRNDLDNIHRNTLRVLEEVGFKVENDVLLEVLAGIGAKIDLPSQIARFPRQVVASFLSECPKVDWKHKKPKLLVRASLYEGKYLDPHSEQLSPLSPECVERYLRLAHALPNINATFITGCPWGPSAELEPLYERFYCWKYGADPSGILYPTAQASRLLDLYQVYAQLKEKPVQELFSGGVFVQSPLRFSAEEAAQFVWWWSRGFRVDLSHMTTAGLTGPVTPAGVVTVHLAEAIAMGLLLKACYGESKLNLMAMLAPLDMRTMMRPYGRPEMAAANLLFAEMARYYGFSCFLHSGVSDAKRPSNESGAQKVISSLSALFAGADAMIDAGLLAADCIYSPVQMILDNELAGALELLLRPYDCSDGAIGYEAIAEAGPGGLFADLTHTVEHFREESWEPSIWSREPLEAWIEKDGKTDGTRAVAAYDALMAEAPPLNCLTEEEEMALLEVIEGKG
ncbi:MAG: trimethylamine methyltransferase family protein [Candidatus Latescibacterota bacterium]